MATPDECAAWRAQLDEKSRYVDVWNERVAAAGRAHGYALTERDRCRSERDAARRAWDGHNGDDERVRLSNAEVALSSAESKVDDLARQLAEAERTYSALYDAAMDLKRRIDSQCSGY